MAEQLNSQRFSGLELLSTSLLEEIIRADFCGDADYDEEMIEYVLEMIAQRRKEEQPEVVPDAQASWRKLQMRLEATEVCSEPPKMPSSSKCKRSFHSGRRALRYVAIVAACVAVIFTVMITVQAMGVDLFGALARWTDSTFRFEAAQNADMNTTVPSNNTNKALYQALSEIGIPVDLAPAWMPPDYSLASVDPLEAKTYKSIYAIYSHPDKEDHITIEICEYINNTSLNNAQYEKNSGDPESYAKDGMTFYLFNNDGTWTATWSDTKYHITIAGASSKELTISIIDSIKEITYE